MSTPIRTSWISLFVSLGICLVMVLIICGALYLREANQIANSTLNLESVRMERFTLLFSHEVGEAIMDLRVLASGDGFQDFLTSGRPSDYERAVRRALFFSKDNTDYDKIRYIDEKGQEIFRINHNGQVVPPDKLQFKGDRPFFQKSNVLNPGEIFVSTIDLNVENEAIEQPIKPTFRVAMPIFDVSGRRRGIYIINYLAAHSIERLRDFSLPQYRTRFRLINAQGYWLAGSKAEEEWGFELPGRSGMTLAKTEPELWAKILKEPAGQVPSQGGYFTWFHAVPRDFYPDKPVKLVAEDDFLIFASRISSEEWNALFVPLRQTFSMVGVLLFVLATAVSWIYHARGKAQQERDRFFSLTRDMLCIAGFDGYFKRVNPAWERTLGYTAEELMMKPFREFVHPEDRARTVEETARLASGGEVISFENRYRSKDGSYRWLLWSARSLMSENIIYGSARDLTERKQIEEKLRQSEERLRLMVENVKDYAIFMLDPAGRVVSWNAGAERLKGYAAEEIVGKHVSIFYPEGKRIERLPDQELMDAASKGRSENEGWRVRKDGSQFWANAVITAVRNGQGDLLGFVKVTRDVTGRKEAAERIQKLNEELQARAELLEVANKELESFSYSVSHDLRAPLRHIHGFVELLQKLPAIAADSSAQRYMDVIAKAAKNMGMLIDDLLAFSRTGRVEMNPVRIKMREMVEQVIREQAADCADRKVTWDIKPLSGAPGDAVLIRLVWVNLIGNAIKYTRTREEAKIEIGEATEAESKAGGREVIYYVRDNGVGFDMRYAAKLFGVFQRLHRAEDFEGTGIGLANVQRIVLRHGGRVWAEGQVGAGATFFFSLPTSPLNR